MARNVMDQLNRDGKVHRGRLGVGIQEITSDLARSLALPAARGVLVNSVEPGGPAQRAGIRTGDVITAVNSIRVDDPNALRNRIASSVPGTEVAITVLREGHEQQIPVRFG